MTTADIDTQKAVFFISEDEYERLSPADKQTGLYAIDTLPADELPKTTDKAAE